MIREKVCGELAFLGVELDKEANQRGGEGKISKEGSKIAVYVFQTDEERMVFSQCLKVLKNGVTK